MHRVARQDGEHRANVSSIIIVTDNASFTQGGEAAIPLRFFQSFRKLGLNVKLFCHERVAKTLQETLTPTELQDVVFFHDSALQKFIYLAGLRLPLRLQEVFVYSACRALTELRQRNAIRKMVKARVVDIVFQPVPISPKALSMMSNIGVPTYFGPLNGNLEYPPALREVSDGGTAVALKIGRAFSELWHYVFTAKRQAAGLFVCNERTLVALPRATRNVPKYRTFDATIDASHWSKVDQTKARDPTHFLYVGRLVDWKAVEIAISATHKLGGRAKLTIVGDGPEREKLLALASSGAGKIEFKGFQSHSVLLGLYSEVNAQLLPSLREAGGNVCLEGLASGVPVIATKWGGATDVVLDGIDGLLIEPSSWDGLVTGFAKAMAELMDDPVRAREMGRRGRERVLSAFDWTEKAKDYLAIFERGHAGFKETSGIKPAHQLKSW